MLLEISGEITPERMKGCSQSKNNTQLWMWLVIEARSYAYCIGRAILHRNLECQVHESRQIGSGQTRDGKSECRHSRNSELKWTGMGEFNSDDHYILLLRAGIPQKKWSGHHGQQKSLKCSTWMQSQKWQNDLCSFLRQTIQYHSNPSLCPNQ